MITRREFVIKAIPAVAISLSLPSAGFAQAARLDEKDPIAVALGYKHDATKVDVKKFPSFAAGRICANCQLFQSKSSDIWAACPAVAGKLVNAKGWCSAWVKKA